MKPKKRNEKNDTNVERHDLPTTYAPHQNSPVTAEHGVRHPYPAGALVEDDNALRLWHAMVGSGVLAIHVRRVAQQEQRHHRKEGVAHRVYATLMQ